jgi:hypothetical protein
MPRPVLCNRIRCLDYVSTFCHEDCKLQQNIMKIITEHGYAYTYQAYITQRRVYCTVWLNRRRSLFATTTNAESMYGQMATPQAKPYPRNYHGSTTRITAQTRHDVQASQSMGYRAGKRLINYLNHGRSRGGCGAVNSMPSNGKRNVGRWSSTNHALQHVQQPCESNNHITSTFTLLENKSTKFPMQQGDHNLEKRLQTEQE